MEAEIIKDLKRWAECGSAAFKLEAIRAIGGPAAWVDLNVEHSFVQETTKQWLRNNRTRAAHLMEGALGLY